MEFFFKVKFLYKGKKGLVFEKTWVRRFSRKMVYSFSHHNVDRVVHEIYHR